MPEETPILSLPLIQAAQAQKHVTHNEALQILDAVVQLAVADRDRTAPPADPAEGARHIVAGTPSGAWAGRSGAVAVYAGGGWTLIDPLPGWSAYVIGEGRAVRWDGAAWKTDGGEVVERLGIGSTPDATNRLAVSSPAVLLNHAGAGMQAKINKATAGDTASLLFQSNWSGRAEMGLAGNDDFSVKVSADGGTWREALRISGASGHLTGEGVQSNFLDATAGRLLTVGAFGLGGNARPVAAADLDALSVSGFYQLSSPVPSVLDAGSSVLHSNHSAGTATQIAMRVGSDYFWFRRKTGGNWSAWRRLDPERGSNGNGEYVRFADGSQICSHALASSQAGAVQWTFPAAFVTTPQVSVTAQSSTFRCGVVDSANGSIANISLYDTGANRQASTARLIAFGRWY